jgi:hydrogenase expression/formation protein HypE
MVIEEGLDMTVLDAVVGSIAAAAAEAGVPVATGDTKVIEHRRGDGLILTTAGVGELAEGVALSAGRIAAGDVVLVSGRIAEHGLAVLSAREGLAFETEIRSDVAPLNGLVAALLAGGVEVKFLRDPTRGGLAGVCVDLAEATGLSVELEEPAIPLSPAARRAAEMLGLDPLTIANEGKLVAVCPAADADHALAVLRANPLGRRAAVIGRFTDAAPPLVELITHAGGRRMVTRPYGEELPRIC